MSTNSILAPGSVRLGLASVSKDDAIRACGQVLVEAGAATPEYVDGMFARELQVSTYIGEGVAIPHGTNESRGYIKAPALGFLQFPEGIDWDGNEVKVCIPIASAADDHLGILASLAEILMEPEAAEQLRTTGSVDEVLTLLSPAEEN
ncbi:MAG: PTS sugar transporter subunit IIA [Propionicimonas sp.]|uniref:PTS sugar transporter subunit IIA n=1 Tax=Propionicimonas sp. TaxID=1955623 RepID=UPI002B202250|nr:PTS sugar transporter subunit IIA [Propionicimonas sp.]MEA4945364.1 PTS sugar transporter subunit IIA [Propionicimonas sp.]MEA5054191.1 PTS sugar transporter subunit IIA [Propionicimonas sp.]MEA5117425.1 PTS sugar transporter subunit IIA [Propionicimonas sp.]